MVGFIDKVKSQIEMWKVEKYTKRRTFLPEYESKDGVYYSSNDQTPPPSNVSTQYKSSLSKRMSVMIKGKPDNGVAHPRCSETYNANLQR
ncbi:unnamed protein product [Cunninghamella echinulata]